MAIVAIGFFASEHVYRCHHKFPIGLVASELQVSMTIVVNVTFLQGSPQVSMHGYRCQRYYPIRFVASEHDYRGQRNFPIGFVASFL